MSTTMTDYPPMKLYNCCIERSNKYPLDRLLSIQRLNSTYNSKILRWFLGQRCRDVASVTDRHLDMTFRLQLVESSSLVSILFREAFNHHCISFFQ